MAPALSTTPSSWSVEIADARKVKGLAPLACKTDRIDAWVLAELSRRDLVPAIWLPNPAVRSERELARFRLHVVKHRTALKNRIHASLMTFGQPCPVSDLFGVGGRQLLDRLEFPEPWRATSRRHFGSSRSSTKRSPTSRKPCGPPVRTHRRALWSDIVLLMVTPATEQVSLADAKAHLSEVVEGIETEHRRVVITKHGRPSVVVLAVEDLEALEDTLELLSDADAMADLREAAAARRTDQTIELTKEEARARWSRG
jgi:prevent-host-death family protein